MFFCYYSESATNFKRSCLLLMAGLKHLFILFVSRIGNLLSNTKPSCTSLLPVPKAITIAGRGGGGGILILITITSMRLKVQIH